MTILSSRARRLASRFLAALLAFCFAANPAHAQFVVTNDDASGPGSLLAAINSAALGLNSSITFSGTDGNIALGSGLSVSNSPTINALGTTALTIPDAITLNGQLGFNMSGVAGTLSGTLSDGGSPGSLFVSDSVGGGVLSVTGNNTFSGGTTIESGTTVGAANDNSLGTGQVSFNGGTLRTQSALTSFTNSLSLAGNGTVDLFGNSSTFSGVVSGPGALTITNTAAGSSMLTLSGANTNSGGFLITAVNGQGSVTVDANAAGALGTGGVIMTGNSSAAFLNLEGFTETIASLAGDTASTLDLGGATLNVGGSGTTTTFAGTIKDTAGAGVLTMNGAGTLILTGNNTYAGGTVLNAGTIGINNANSLGAGGLTFGGGVLQLEAVVTPFNTAIVLNSAGGTLDVNSFAANLGGLVSGTGALTIMDSSAGGAGAATLSGANNTYSGGTNITAGGPSANGVVLNADAVNTLGTGGVNLTGSSGISLATLNLLGNAETIASLAGNANSVVDLGGAALTIGGTAANTTFAGVLQDSGGGGTLTMNETNGTLALSGNNTYAGGTILTAGTIGITNSASLGTGALALNGGTLQTQAALTNYGTAIDLGGAGTIDLDGNSSSFNSGIINGSGAVTFTNGGTAGAVLTLQGTNGYTGGTTIANTAIVGISEAAALGTGGLTFSGGTLQLEAVVTPFNAAIVLNSGGGTLDVNSFTTNLGGLVSGTGALTITDSSAGGAGAATLSGANNTYSGGTNITAGGPSANGVVLNADAVNTLGTGGVNLAGSSSLSLATLNLLGNAETIASLAGNANSNVDLDGAALTIHGTAASTTFSGVLQDTAGGGTLTMAETGGTLLLTGANTYAGGTNLNAGTIAATNNASLGTGGLTFNGGTLQTQAALTSFGNAIDLAGTGTVDVDGNTSSFLGIVSGGGALNVIDSASGGGVLNLTNVFNSYTGGTVIGTGATVGAYVDGSLGTGALNFDGGALRTVDGLSRLGVPIVMTANGTVDLFGNASYFAGVVSGAGTLTITDASAGGGGSLTLAGANSGTGGVDVAGGTGAGAAGVSVLAAATDALGAGGVAMTGGTGGATLSLDGFAESISSLAGDAKSTLDLDGAALTVGGSGTTTTFAGLIKDTAGTGSLNMNGAGTLILRGANTYAGGTNLDAGTLAIKNNASLGTGAASFNGGILQTQAALSNFANAVNLTGAGGTVDVDGFSSTFSGAVNGGGGLTVSNGATGGVLTLSGSDGFTGGTTINAGATLALSGTGSLGTGSLIVNGGTFDLGGLNRTIGGGVVNNGTVATGLGTLTTPSYGGTGTLNVSLQSAAPALNVTGAANVASGALTLGNHPAGGTYTAIAAGTLTGTFAPSAITISPDYLYTISYAGNDVTLTLQPKLASFAQTPNQRAVANALFNLAGVSTSPDLRAVLAQLDGLPSAQANVALDEMSPRMMTSLSSMQYAASTLQTSAIGRHLAGLSVGGASPTVASDDLPAGTLIASGGVGDTPESFHDTVKTKDFGEYFGSAIGSQGRIDPQNGATGTQPGFTFTSGGGTVGVNTPGSEDFVLGFALGYVGSAANVDAGEGSVFGQSVRGGAFAAKRIDDFHGNLYVGGAFDSFSVSRVVPTLGRDATSTPSGTEIDVAGSAAYDLRLRGATFTPTLDLTSDHLTIGPAKESGAGSLDENVGSQDVHSLRSDVGGKLSYRFGGAQRTLTPFVSAAYEHEFMSQSQNIEAQFASGGGPFTITTADIARSGMLLAAGFTLDWSSGSSLRVEYSKDTRANYDVNTLLLNLSARFQ